MKKYILLLAAALILPANVKALNITDPFFMPAQGQIISDTSLGFTNNAFKLDKSWGLYESLSAGFRDNLMLGISFGWADIKHEDSGLQDIAIYGKYRFMSEISHGRFLDLDVYFSPKMFDSPFNGDEGAAKGSTDFAMHGTIGSTSLLDNFTLGARFGFKYMSSTDTTSSGSAWDLTGLGKYYLDDYNSLGFSLALKSYLGFDKDFFGFALGVNYSHDIIEDKFALTPYYNIEKHTKDVPSAAVWGLNARYLF